MEGDGERSHLCSSLDLGDCIERECWSKYVCHLPSVEQHSGPHFLSSEEINSYHRQDVITSWIKKQFDYIKYSWYLGYCWVGMHGEICQVTAWDSGIQRWGQKLWEYPQIGHSVSGSSRLVLAVRVDAVMEVGRKGEGQGV